MRTPLERTARRLTWTFCTPPKRPPRTRAHTPPRAARGRPADEGRIRPAPARAGRRFTRVTPRAHDWRDSAAPGGSFAPLARQRAPIGPPPAPTACHGWGRRVRAARTAPRQRWDAVMQGSDEVPRTGARPGPAGGHHARRRPRPSAAARASTPRAGEAPAPPRGHGTPPPSGRSPCRCAGAPWRASPRRAPTHRPPAPPRTGPRLCRGAAPGQRPVQGGDQLGVIVRRPDPARGFPNPASRCAATSQRHVMRACRASS